MKNVVNPPYVQTEENGLYTPPELRRINQATVKPVSTLDKKNHNLEEGVRQSQVSRTLPHKLCYPNATPVDITNCPSLVTCFEKVSKRTTTP